MGMSLSIKYVGNELETQWPYGLKNSSFHYSHAPRGPRGVKETRIFILQIKLLSFCAKIDQKLKKLWKTIKIPKKVHKTFFKK